MGSMNPLAKAFETVQAGAVYRDRPRHHAASVLELSVLELSYVSIGFVPSSLAQTAHHNNVELP